MQLLQEDKISVLCDRAKFELTNDRITLQVCSTRIRTNLGQVEEFLASLILLNTCQKLYFSRSFRSMIFVHSIYDDIA